MSRSTESLLWVGAGALLGFLLSSLFSGWLHLDRNVFLVPYVIAVSAFLAAYFRATSVDVPSLLRDRVLAGLLGGGLFGALVVSNVLSQPPSAVPTGAKLLLALVWPGFVYGLVDALLLSVMPVLAVGRLAFGDGVRGRVTSGAAALVASAIVTAAYHLGYPEFRGTAVAGPVIGNVLLTLSYVLSRSPLAPITGHIAMHLAAVLHGMETATQLPPH